MGFEKLDDRQHVRNTNYLIGGVLFALFGALIFIVNYMELLGNPMPPVIYMILSFGSIFCGVGLIAYAFMGTMSRYFMTSDGKCALVRNSHCTSGDCRKCVFADTYLKYKMTAEESEKLFK